MCHSKNSRSAVADASRMDIFGVPIDNLPPSEIRKRLWDWLETPGFHRVTTINPEFLLLAEHNPVFRTALLSADLRIADGAGLHFPFWLAGETLIGRYPGADLLADLLAKAEETGIGVRLFLRPDGLSRPETIREALRNRYPKLFVVLDQEAPDDVRFRIALSNYGAPLQEIYLERFRSDPGPLRVALGVGGAFDFLTGKIPRAPKLLRSMGLEWAWRLWQQPQRFRRIWGAVVLFPLRVLSQK
jgi:N-acetylglucosaminyldiphosphoundecaprenol N-acetyl-beta-D-mannosaminyltransferase